MLGFHPLGAMPLASVKGFALTPLPPSPDFTGTGSAIRTGTGQRQGLTAVTTRAAHEASTTRNAPTGSNTRANRSATTARNGRSGSNSRGGRNGSLSRR